MADLVAANVTITVQAGDPHNPRIEGVRRKSVVKIAFGDGALTYPTNGVPLPTFEKFGLTRNIADLVLLDANDGVGIVWKYDRENHKLRGWRSAGFTPAGTVAAPVFTGDALAAHTHDLTVIGGAAGGIDEPLGVEGGDTLAKDAATDRTIAGADSATKGGVVAVTAGTPAGTNSAPAFTGTAVAAASLLEITGAVAAQVLYAEAAGW